MRKLALLLAVAALASLAVGQAVAHSTFAIGTLTNNAVVGPIAVRDIYYPVPLVNDGDIHDITVWEETNGCYGLQENADDVAADGCPAGTLPDQQVA